ncbi:MAG: hypothetical protein ACRD09_05565, partial [Vicinamibacterales bacterium]
MRTDRLSWVTVLVAGTIAAGCGSTKARPAAAPKAAPAAPAVVQAAPPAPPKAADPIADLIALSERHYAAGEREMKLGHLDQARTEFDRAVD